MSVFDQQEFDIRLEWGLKGIEMLAPVSDLVIIVDVLSFSTCVDAGTSAGATIFPYRWKDESAAQYAKQTGAELAGKRGAPGYSLSPLSFLQTTEDSKVVLPSPNGATLSLATGYTHTICGCLRNARAVAAYAMENTAKIAIIPAGETWHGGELRPAFEDLLGAGAIISYLAGILSPESETALALFKQTSNIFEQIKKCSSGKELIAKGFESDVRFAAHLNASDNVPVLHNGAYRRSAGLSHH